jgi:hypothetical protein
MGRISARLTRRSHHRDDIDSSEKGIMIFVRLLRALREADARKREQDWITSVIHGPETAFRSELVEVLSRGTK